MTTLAPGRRTLDGRPALFLVIAAGGASSAAWVIHASLPLVWQQARAFNWWLAVPAVALTLGNLSLRLIRWQFFLRCAGARLPIRQSAQIFIAGLAMLLTPAYAGEGVKAWLVGRALSRSAPGGLAKAAVAVVAERLFDAVALALLGGTGFLLAGEFTVGAALCAAGIAGVIGIAGAGRGVPSLVAAVARLRGLSRVTRDMFALDGAGVGIALLLSCSAWLAGCLTLSVVCAGAQFALSPAEAVATYAASTLLGGLTLLPAGVGVVGTAILVKLEGYGATLQQAVLAALLVRALTTWLTAAIGVAGCWWVWRRQRNVARADATEPSHFDVLAPHYAEQLSPAARERVVARKAEIMRQALRDAAIGPDARLLDAGCGHGWYLDALAGFGYRLTGIDVAPGQLVVARAEVSRCGHRSSIARLAAGSVLALPFATDTFDAAYTINVLHHIGGSAAQHSALAELARVVRPGGLVFVHEINTVNPLFRLYMAYLFPLWKRIDLGTEAWLDPRRLPQADTLALVHLQHYTFLPDFTPRALYRLGGPLEAWLERSRWAPLAAHFTAVYRRRAAGRRAGPVAQAHGREADAPAASAA